MTDAPLRGKSVVITRAEGDADGLKQRLEALGARVTVAPSIVMRPRPVDDAIRRAVAQLPQTAWVVFASRQGVLSFRGILDALNARLPSSVRLAVVGPGTAEICTECLRKPDLVATPSHAEGLAAALVALAQPRDGVVLLPAAAAGRVVLRERLLAAGFAVNHVIVYDTKPATAQDGPVQLPARVDYVLFTSPSTVEGFLARSVVPHGSLVVTIGPTTSAAVRARGLQVAHEAAAHSLDGLIDTLTKGVTP